MFKKFLDRLTFEKRVMYLALYSVLVNLILAITKFIMAYYYRNSGGGFFLISGIVNIFIICAKMICYRSATDKNHFKIHTFLCGLFVIIAGCAYTAYMARLLFFDSMHISFPQWLSITWACVAFVELYNGVNGLFKVRGKGHMYRNIMVINLGISFYAIVLAQVMITSASVDDSWANLYDGLFGIIMGILNVILGIFIWIAPKISLVGKTHNEYVLVEGAQAFEDPTINIILVSNPIYGKVTYLAFNEHDKISGDIIREYYRFKDLKWYMMIPIIIFYVVLIIPYLIGALIYYFYSSYSIVKLDKQMEKNGYQKIIK